MKDSKYDQLLKKIYSQTLYNAPLDLEKLKKLDALLSHPSKAFKSIHIAGTNGKGSITTKLAYGFQYSGYKVGLYTSPHIHIFRERIKINSKMISKKELVSILSTIFDLIEHHNLEFSFFEISTILAFKYFAQKKIDIAIVETGLGGRLDATNILNPIATVISTIDFDHMKILGNTLEKIAFEKAGIIKKNTPLFLNPKAIFKSIKSKARELNAPIHISKKIDGFYDLQNSEVAQDVLRYFKNRFHLSQNAIKRALKKRPPCRFEVYSKKSSLAKYFEKFPTKIILDVAHNPEGLKNLFETVSNLHSTHIRALIGICEDKDIKSCAEILSKYCSSIHLVDSSHPRIAKKEYLATFFPKEKIVLSKDLESSFKEAITAAKNDEILVICGSFFIIQEIKTLINHLKKVSLRAKSLISFL